MTPTQLELTKREFEEYFNGRICNGYGESDPDTRLDIWQWFESKLEEQYLLGAKDMREAVKIKDINRNYSDSCQAGFNIAVKELDSKAQQFLDSLEGKK